MHRRGIASPLVGRAAYVPPEQDFTETLFNQFVKAHSFKGTLSSFFTLCEQVKLEQFRNHGTFFSSLKEAVKCWRANSLWSLLTPLAEREVYRGGSTCTGQKVLIIGAGPCGLRTAIECAFLGAKVVVVEKRDDFYRNNVLHLWPFVIKDLRKLGAKILYPKFCPGNINHISICKLQLLLLKICLCLGVEVRQAGFVDLVEPPEDQCEATGWRVKLEPEGHQLSSSEFDIVIGADGRRNVLKGFERKKAGRALAIAITFNFVNYNSSEEAKVGEIGGISLQFRQDFFQELRAMHGIDLENLVYYKDETHYFVVTAKKSSLLKKGVLKEEKPTVEELLSQPNVDRDQLKTYALELAQFSTTLPKYDFAINHHGDPDVAMFDFTSVFQACHPAIIREKNGHKLLVALVGDGLYQPFWPQGTGCGRGFLSAFNAAWMVRDWALGEKEPLSILAERESLYLLLPVTPQGLSPAIDRYSIDPETRYIGLKTKTRVGPDECQHLINPEEHEGVERKKRKFADPWKSVVDGAQKNNFIRNLASGGSCGANNGSEVNGEALQKQLSANGIVRNDGEAVRNQFGLRKVRNSLVAADAEEEMRRNKELNDERGREQTTQESDDSEEEVERGDHRAGAASGQTQVQSDSGEIRQNGVSDKSEMNQSIEAPSDCAEEGKQDGEFNVGEQEEGSPNRELDWLEQRDRVQITQKFNESENRPEVRSVSGGIGPKKVWDDNSGRYQSTQKHTDCEEEGKLDGETVMGEQGARSPTRKLPDEAREVREEMKEQAQEPPNFEEGHKPNDKMNDEGRVESIQIGKHPDIGKAGGNSELDEEEKGGGQTQRSLIPEEIEHKDELSDLRETGDDNKSDERENGGSQTQEPSDPGDEMKQDDNVREESPDRGEAGGDNVFVKTENGGSQTQELPDPEEETKDELNGAGQAAISQIKKLSDGGETGSDNKANEGEEGNRQTQKPSDPKERVHKDESNDRGQVGTIQTERPPDHGKTGGCHIPGPSDPEEIRNADELNDEGQVASQSKELPDPGVTGGDNELDGRENKWSQIQEPLDPGEELKQEDELNDEGHVASQSEGLPDRGETGGDNELEERENGGSQIQEQCDPGEKVKQGDSLDDGRQMATQSDELPDRGETGDNNWDGRENGGSQTPEQSDPGKGMKQEDELNDEERAGSQSEGLPDHGETGGNIESAYTCALSWKSGTPTCFNFC